MTCEISAYILEIKYQQRYLMMIKFVMIMRPVKKTVGRNIFFETVGIVLFCCPENAFGVHLTLTLVSVVLALLELIYV